MLENKKRIIIKIGSNLLVKDGFVKKSWLESLAQDILYLRSLNKEVVIVTSGAIAVGKKSLNTQGELTLQQKQAACSIGQIELMSEYQRIFANHNISIAQILLTSLDSSHRASFLNAKNTFLTLIENNVVAIVNENDTIATQEIRIGDNDRLAARVAQMVDADLLILLSDIDGLYEQNPQINKDAKFIELVEEINETIEDMASHSISGVGSGGMITKIKAANMAFNSGCDTIITSGKEDNPIKNLLSGAKHTLFKSNKKKIAFKKQWIVDEFNPKGEVVINQNAHKALNNGSSLLSVGVIEVSGIFEEGDNIIIKDQNKNHIASGISNYSSGNAKLIMGKNTKQIKEIFGDKIKEELIHRDNLVII